MRGSRWGRRYGLEGRVGASGSPAPRPTAPPLPPPTLGAFLSRLERVSRAGNGWIARCPAHEDGRPSLSIGERQDGGLLVNCFAGCKPEAIVGTLGLSMRDLMPENGGTTPQEAPRLRVAAPAPDAAAFWDGLAWEDALGIAYLTGRKLWPLPPDLARFDTCDPLYRIAVPLSDAAGRIVNVERRAIANAEPRMKCLAGAPKKGTAFGQLNEKGPVWIVEGLADFLAASILAERLGVCPLGAPGAENAAPLVEARGPQLSGRRVYVSMDSDPAGKKAEADTCHALAAVGAEAIPARYPAGFKDLAELVEKAGADAAAEIMGEVLAAGRPWSESAGAEGSGEGVPDEAAEPPEGLAVPDAPLDPASFLANEPRNLVRLRTGFETLDRATRGGIPTGIVTTLLGPPRVGKTALGSQEALRAASEGFLVLMIFKDEGRFAGTVRLGQQLGLDRTKLENQDPEEIERFREALIGRAIYVPDPDSEHWTLENAIAWLETNAAGRPRLLFVDSIQYAYATCAENGRSLREEITAKIELLEDAAKRGAMVIVISEMNRSAYRNKREEDNTRGIASGAESRAIEYKSRLILSLDGDAEQIVTAKVEKNSPGGKQPILRLQFDASRATFREIHEEEAASVVEEAQRAEDERRRAKVREKIRKALRQRLELNVRGLIAETRVNKDLLAEVRDEMVEDGKLTVRQDGQAKLYRLPEVEGGE